MAALVRSLYTATLLGLALYAAQALILIVLYLVHRRDDDRQVLPGVSEESLPSVTVQVPLRNERHVATRVMQAVGALDWPRDRLEIQVLDDSDDETCALVATAAARLEAAGLRVQVLRRETAVGYKAGALAEGLTRARGEFVAIFDADFCPDPRFLRQTVPHFLTDPALGMVQARWGHLNADYSLITRVQALALDAHFAIEHLARNRSGLLMNFNGAGGVWRRSAIEDAGGWCADTVTEDLDLSYRAQLAGWRALYLPHVAVPAELTPLLAAFKAQQARWAKGASQCLRKLGGPILRSHRLNWAQKAMALLHLSGYLNQPLLLLMILLTLPMVLTDPYFSDFSLWLGALASVPPLLYILGQMALYRDWLRRVLAYPFLMFLWVGMTLKLTIALVEGLVCWGGAFVRTPKYRIRGRSGRWQTSDYRAPVSAVWVGELALGLYVGVAIWLALRLDHHHLLPLVGGYALGQLLILAVTLAQAVAIRRSAG